MMPYAKLPEGFPKPTIPPKRYFEDEKWFAEHAHELAQQYPDQWIAIFNREVIAAGKDGGEVEKLAHEKTGERDILIDFVTPTRKFYSCHA